MSDEPVVMDPVGAFVYVLWGEDAATPLYVGSSTNVLARVGAHMGDKRKRALVRRIELRRCADKATMLALELAVIAELTPEWNIVGLTDRDERSRRTGWLLGVKPERPRRDPAVVDARILPCSNCGCGMSGVGTDRPRHGRCEACYRYLKRTRTERPIDLCPRGQEQDEIGADIGDGGT